MPISLDQPLDTSLPEADALLSSIQGNILKSHGRDHAAHVFLTYGADPAKNRRWLAEFARNHVTNASRQKRARNAWMADGGPGQLFTSVGLAYTGYQALQIPDAEIPADPDFRLGMKNQAQSRRPYNDPPAEQWEASFQGRVDAIIIFAHDDPKQLADAVTQTVASLQGIASAIWVEGGSRLLFSFPGEAEPTTIEHFGYEDGISNPLFYLDDIAAERAARGSVKWDPAAELALALVAEPDSEERYGSYFVFRKLEQNVAGFRAALEKIAAMPGGSGDADQIGAMAVGRFRNGAPLIPTPPATDPSGNDFHFKTDDPDGAVCPFHAHIRKTNPRGDTPLPANVERMFRIVRRGITYGQRPDLSPGATLPPPAGGVGLLFMSCQSRLEQFAIQQEGSDSNDFAQAGVGVDAVIGQNSTPVPQEWPKGSGVRFTMANFVKMLGGEYFFMPSIGMLTSL